VKASVWVGAALLGVALQAWAGPQGAPDEVAAIVTSVKKSVKVQRAGERTAVPARLCQRLYENDKILVGEGGSAEIVTPDGEYYTIGAGEAFSVPPKQAGRTGNGLKDVLRRLVRDLLKRLKGAEKPGRNLLQRGMTMPLVALQPAKRAGENDPALLVAEGRRATFYWTAPGGAEQYVLEIRRGYRLLYAAKVFRPPVEGTVPELAVAALTVELPPLQEGLEYTWTIEAGGDSDRAAFRLATAQEREQIRSDRNQLAQDETFAEQAGAHLMLGAACEEIGAVWDAAREYHLAIEADPSQPTGYLLLASLCRRAGLYQLAGDMMGRASELQERLEGR